MYVFVVFLFFLLLFFFFGAGCLLIVCVRACVRPCVRARVCVLGACVRQVVNSTAGFPFYSDKHADPFSETFFFFFFS